MSALLRLAIAALILAAAPARAIGGSDRALAALKSGGHYGLMRHAKAPGKGDPETFRAGDCTTQRNLDAEGREQALRIGAALRGAGIVIFKVYAGIVIFKVYASRWCRGMETAELLAVGVRASALVEPLDILNSFHATPEREREQTRNLAALVSEPIASHSVTHHDNIVSLTRIVTREGDIVVVKPQGWGKFEIVGHIRADALRD